MSEYNLGLPKYAQLAQQLRQEIEAGSLRPGDRLPSVPQQQKHYGASKQTLERVHTLLEQEGLIERRNGIGIFVAEPRQKAQNGIIAVVSNFPSRHPYYVELLQGAQDATNHHSRLLLIPLDTVKSVRQATDWEKVDGVLVCNPYMENIVYRLPAGMPCISLLNPVYDFSHVLADDFGGMSQAVQHLLGLGHRRIALLGTGPHPDPAVTDASSRRRLAAYRQEMHAAGIAVPDVWMRAIHKVDEPALEFVGMGRSKMRQWLDEDWAELGCTALLVQNDDAAIGVIETLQEAGYRVPEDVSVIGFDGAASAEHFRPQLSTVVVPLYEIGKAGATQLLKEIDMPLSALRAPIEPVSVTLPCNFRIGKSTAPAKI